MGVTLWREGLSPGCPPGGHRSVTFARPEVWDGRTALERRSGERRLGRRNAANAMRRAWHDAGAVEARAAARAFIDA